ncbi:MAG: SRPBCC domain-containing protein [Saprospiraceae bacterium]|nr:SRPBCC domain-containing protein [Saprospiraceae bacterium]
MRQDNMKFGDPPIVVAQSFMVSVERVWDAITVPDQMTQWYFENMPDFKPEVGFQTSFLTEVEDRRYTHQWEVTDVVPGRQVTYRWTYKEHPGVGHVVFTIAKTGTQSTLTLTNTIDRDFPEDVPEFQREACMGGWDYFIRNRLKQFLDPAAPLL